MGIDHRELWGRIAPLNPSPITKLKLPQSPRAKIFRLIDNQLRNNADLRRVVRENSFKSYTGDSNDNTHFALDMLPGIRLSPSSGPDQFWANDSMRGNLSIDVEMVTEGLCWDDIDSLWYLIEKALYPRAAVAGFSEQDYFFVALQQAGAHTGLCEFSAVVADPDPGDANAFIGRGIIRIEYRIGIRI